MKPWAKIVIGNSMDMSEIESESIGLIITSPPYWHIKDYEIDGQIGYGQTLHEYLKDLYRVWEECFRVLESGRRLCINIGDQFARSVIYGRYKIIPLHAEVISQCEKIGFDYMGSIIWQKKTTMNTTGGAVIMGSYPYPPNGMIEIDYEFILIFKKPGKNKKVSKIVKEYSKLSKEEWKEYFSGHWKFGGEKQVNHEAMFPEELPKRLIKMYSFVGETVLDPFLGSGTTVKAALKLHRNAIGYEINENFLEIIKEKVGMNSLLNSFNIQIVKKFVDVKPKEVDYKPIIKDAKPQMDPNKLIFKKETFYRVVEIVDEATIKLNTGLLVKFLGVEVVNKEETMKYLNEYLLKKDIMLKFENENIIDGKAIYAYVYLKNKIFVNAYLIKSGLAKADRSKDYRMKKKFLKLEKELKNV